MPSSRFLRIAIVAVFALFSVLSGCEKPQPAAIIEQPIRVDVVTAVRSSKAPTTVLTGRLEAYRTAEIRARVAGIVEKRTYTEGSEVKAGALLFLIDPAPLKASLAAAEAELAQAGATADAASDVAQRSRQLRDYDSISVQQYRKDLFLEKQLRAAEQLAAAKVRSARLQLDYASVTSPITGRARRAMITEGAMVGQDEGTKLTTVEQIDPIYVNFSQPATEFLALRKATVTQEKNSEPMPVNVRLGDGSLYGTPGKLLFSDTAVDPQTDTVAMRALFSNPDHLLLPGMYVQVEFQRPEAQTAVLIPQHGLTRTRTGAFVMLEVNGHARQVAVTADTLEGKQWRVTSGLTGGERVILDGGALSDGQAVQAKSLTSNSSVAERQ
ncbi:efflux RND transporter periplasmic adaptor subunit [Pseudomonas huanghezhanensis]|uniref:efflux RND transporter periplasmic adaptor subunit n=1 Tax=Pseudomonas huanghezhanensis TaxID=3002903 RepID=UPI0022858761|nr:efflux RND transporter periplasmic adaptor subunit [Pseudomonas sp. BSw22131]